MKVLITGASGFVGRATATLLLAAGHKLVCPLRPEAYALQRKRWGEITPLLLPAIDETTDWQMALQGVETVVHLAGMAHVRTQKPFDLYERFYRLNTEATKNLARQAAEAGVKRLVFLSSIGVNGSTNKTNQPFRETDQSAPDNAYTMTKFKAEQALRLVEAETGMEVVILRPPLVYGPHVKANFLHLLEIVYKGIPMPFANLRNCKRFIGLDNLAEVIALCVNHQQAAGKTFLVSDTECVSTPELIRHIANAMKTTARFFPIPVQFASLCCRLLGKKRLYEQLWGNLDIDTSHVQQQLGWIPKVPLAQGIDKTVDWFLSSRC